MAETHSKQMINWPYITTGISKFSIAKLNMIEPNYNMGLYSLIFILKLQYFTRIFTSKKIKRNT